MSPNFEPPDRIYWLALIHSCGCCIDWGVDADERERLPDFLSDAVHFPCPWQGSATGVPSKVSESGVGYLAASDVWYRKAAPGLREDGQRNRDRALRATPAIPVTKAEEIHEVKLAMARHAPVLELPTVAAPEEKGLVLNVRRVATALPKEQLAWIETTDGTLYRLPPQLQAWAFDLVALVLAHGGNQQAHLFPTEVSFGQINGRAFANIL